MQITYQLLYNVTCHRKCDTVCKGIVGDLWLLGNSKEQNINAYDVISASGPSRISDFGGNLPTNKIFHGSLLR